MIDTKNQPPKPVFLHGPNRAERRKVAKKANAKHRWQARNIHNKRVEAV